MVNLFHRKIWYSRILALLLFLFLTVAVGAEEPAMTDPAVPQTEEKSGENKPAETVEEAPQPSEQPKPSTDKDIPADKAEPEGTVTEEKTEEVTDEAPEEVPEKASDELSEEAPVEAPIIVEVDKRLVVPAVGVISQWEIDNIRHDNYEPKKENLTAIAPITYDMPVEDWKRKPLDPFVGDDGLIYVPLYTLLRDMGYEFNVYKQENSDSLIIRWNDKNWGDFWIDTKTNFIHGPETLYQLSWVFVTNGQPYVPVQAVVEAMFWTYSYNYENRQITVERLQLTRFQVNKTMQLFSAYGNDINGVEKHMRTCLTTTGTGFGSTPSRTFYVSPLPLTGQHKYLFPTAKVWIKYCSQISGNICAHTPYTRTYSNIDTYDMQKGYQALGSRASDGCIRFTYNDAKYVYYAGANMPFQVIDGTSTKENTAEKDRLYKQQPRYNDWIKQMKLYE